MTTNISDEFSTHEIDGDDVINCAIKICYITPQSMYTLSLRAWIAESEKTIVEFFYYF